MEMLGNAFAVDGTAMAMFRNELHWNAKRSTGITRKGEASWSTETERQSGVPI